MPLACAYPMAAGRARLRHRDDQVRVRRALGGELPADFLPRGLQAAARDRGVRPGQVDVLEQAAPRGRRARTVCDRDPVLVDRDHLARLDLAHERRADDVQRRRLAGDRPAARQPPEYQRPESLRVAGRVQGLLVHEDQRERAADQRQRRQRGRLDAGMRCAGPFAVPAARRLGAANRAVSTSVSEVARLASPPPCRASSAASSSVLIRFPLWPRARLADGVARNVGCAFSQTDEPLVEYRQCPTAMWPAQGVEHRLVEDLGDQAHVLVDDDPASRR